MTSAALLVALVAASLLAGCASSYGPASRPLPPTGDESRPAEAPAPGAADRNPPASPAQDARAPTLALLRQSERSAGDGDLDSAIAYVERAIRLKPRDATLWLRLARLQLTANRPATAEQLAHRAIALAGSEERQRREGWLLLADALEAQGEDEAAAGIRARWRTYRG